jgi:hypothetical protein
MIIKPGQNYKLTSLNDKGIDVPLSERLDSDDEDEVLIWGPHFVSNEDGSKVIVLRTMYNGNNLSMLAANISPKLDRFKVKIDIGACSTRKRLVSYSITFKVVDIMIPEPAFTYDNEDDFEPVIILTKNQTLDIMPMTFRVHFPK